MGREWQSLRLAQAIAGSERFNASPECLLSFSGLLHGKSMAGIESCHVQNCCAHVSFKALGQLAHNEGTQTMQASKSQHGPWLFFCVFFSTIHCCRRSIYIIWCPPVVSHRQRLRIARHSRLQPSTLSWGGQSIFGTSWTLLNRGWLKLLALHVNALDTFGYHFTGIYEGNIVF